MASLIALSLAVFVTERSRVSNYMSFNSGPELLLQGFESDTTKFNLHFFRMNYKIVSCHLIRALSFCWDLNLIR